MDSITMTRACAAPLANIARLGGDIKNFVLSVRDARKDMDRVSRELSSLSLDLEALHEDVSRVKFPTSLVPVVHSCDRIVDEMRQVLQKLYFDGLNSQIEWTVAARDEMSHLSSSLERHKSAVELALEMASIHLKPSVKSPSGPARDAKQDSSQIRSLLYEIGLFRMQISTLQTEDSRERALLRSFLTELTDCVECMADAAEVPEADRVLEPFHGETTSKNKDQQSDFASGFYESRTHTNFAAEGTAQRYIESHIFADSRAETEAGSESGEPTESDVELNQTDKSKPAKPSMDTSSGKASKDGLLITAQEIQRDDDSLYRSQAGPSSPPQISAKAKSKLDHALQDVVNNPAGFHTIDELGRWIGGPNNRIEKAAKLLDRGADPSLPGLPSPALHNASLRGPIKMVKLLLDRGADVNAAGGMYGNALQAAICGWFGNNDVIQLLLASGADVNAPGGMHGSPLEAACAMGRLDVVDILLRSGASVRATDGIDGSPLEAAYRLDPDSAVGKHRDAILKLLLRYGAAATELPVGGHDSRAELRADPAHVSELTGDQDRHRKRHELNGNKRAPP